MNELLEVIYAGDLIEDHTDGSDGGFYRSVISDSTPYRYIHDEIIGWEAVYKQMPELLKEWGFKNGSCDNYTVESNIDPDSLFSPRGYWHDAFFVCSLQLEDGIWLFDERSEEFLLRNSKPRSINDLKAILRSIDPALIEVKK